MFSFYFLRRTKMYCKKQYARNEEFSLVFLAGVVLKISSNAMYQQTFLFIMTSQSRRIYMPWSYVFTRRLQGVLIKTIIYSSSSYLLKTSSRRFQDIFRTSSRCLQNVLQKLLQDIFKTSFQDVSKTSCKDTFETSSRRFQGVFKTSSWRLQDVSSSQTVLVNASSRRLQNVFETYCEDRKIGLGHTSEKFMVRKQIFQGRILWISWNF